MIWPAAIAASAAVVVLSFLLWQRHDEHARVVVTDAYGLPVVALPVSLEDDLIKTHDGCCKEPNHQHLPVLKTDDAAIAGALHARLHQPTLVYHPQDTGWQFRGAAICPVGSTPSGHLMFAKGTAALSIFSLPLSLIPGAPEGYKYSDDRDHHCIVGFVKDGALFCVVGSGPVDTIDIDQLKQMESAMIPAVARAQLEQPLVLAELLQPIRH